MSFNSDRVANPADIANGFPLSVPAWYTDPSGESLFIISSLDEKAPTDKEFGAYFDLRQKKINHKISIQLYNKCKDYYKPIEVPTTVVYFDEIRKSKKKEKVIIHK